MSQQELTTGGFIEALQDEIAAASGLTYTVSGRYANLFVGQAIDLDARSKINSLTLFEDNTELVRGGRLTLQYRNVRFAVRGTSGPQPTLNVAHDLLEWIDENRVFTRDTFTARFARLVRPPTVAFHGDNGVTVADFSVEYLVTSK